MKGKHGIGFALLRAYSHRMETLIQQYGQKKLNRAHNQPATAKNRLKRRAALLKRDIDRLLKQPLSVAELSLTPLINRLLANNALFLRAVAAHQPKAACLFHCCSRRHFLTHYQRIIHPMFESIFDAIHVLTEIPTAHAKDVLLFLCQPNAHNRTYRQHLFEQKASTLLITFQSVENKISRYDLAQTLADIIDFYTNTKQGDTIFNQRDNPSLCRRL